MLNYENATWSLEVLIWLPILILLGAALLAIAVWGLKISLQGVDDGLGLFISGPASITLILLVGLMLYGYYPYEKPYHSYAKTAGTVDEIDSRLFASNDLSEKYVVRFEGSDQQYSCVDTRCANVRKGDELGLSCIRVFEYAAEDGYDCRFLFATHN